MRVVIHSVFVIRLLAIRNGKQIRSRIGQAGEFTPAITVMLGCNAIAKFSVGFFSLHAPRVVSLTDESILRLLAIPDCEQSSDCLPFVRIACS